MRRYNRKLKEKKLEIAIHSIRTLHGKIANTTSLDSLRGIEGKASERYFNLFRFAIQSPDFIFDGRNRRPPRDPVNSMLSFGYALLENAVHAAVNITALDPYQGALHSVEYGKPSMVLDIMEEFRALLVDILVLRLINRNMILLSDFYFAEDDEDVKLPVRFTGEGIRKFITHFEKSLSRIIFYPRLNCRLSYRQICLEQARWIARHIKGEEAYRPFTIR